MDRQTDTDRHNHLFHQRNVSTAQKTNLHNYIAETDLVMTFRSDLK